MVNIESVRLRGPEHEVWERNYYISLHGDPLTNGKGHSEYDDEGVPSVLVPAPPVKKMLHDKGQSMNIRQKVDGGTLDTIMNLET